MLGPLLPPLQIGITEASVTALSGGLDDGDKVPGAFSDDQALRKCLLLIQS